QEHLESEMDVATCSWLPSREHHLVDDLLRWVVCAIERACSPNISLFGILFYPPPQQHRKTLIRRVDWPIKLRRKVIDPPSLQPKPRVGIEILVSVQPFYLRRILCPPNSERTHP